VKVYI
jgi:hypothetical protein